MDRPDIDTTWIPCSYAMQWVNREAKKVPHEKPRVAFVEFETNTVTFKYGKSKVGVHNLISAAWDEVVVTFWSALAIGQRSTLAA